MDADLSLHRSNLSVLTCTCVRCKCRVLTALAPVQCCGELKTLSYAPRNWGVAVPHQEYDNDFGNWAKYPDAICSI